MQSEIFTVPAQSLKEDATLLSDISIPSALQLHLSHPSSVYRIKGNVRFLNGFSLNISPLISG